MYNVSLDIGKIILTSGQFAWHSETPAKPKLFYSYLLMNTEKQKEHWSTSYFSLDAVLWNNHWVFFFHL